MLHGYSSEFHGGVNLRTSSGVLTSGGQTSKLHLEPCELTARDRREEPLSHGAPSLGTLRIQPVPEVVSAHCS